MNPQWKALKDQASKLKVEKKFKEAAECLKAAITKASKANPCDISLLYNNLASVCLLDNEFILAEQAARKSVSLELEFGDAGAETTHLADFYIMLTKTLEKQNRFSEAREYAQRSAEIFRKLLGDDSEYVQGVYDYVNSLKANEWRG